MPGSSSEIEAWGCDLGSGEGLRLRAISYSPCPIRAIKHMMEPGAVGNMGNNIYINLWLPTCARWLGRNVWPIAESEAKLLSASRTANFSNVILRVRPSPKMAGRHAL